MFLNTFHENCQIVVELIPLITTLTLTVPFCVRAFSFKIH